MRDAAHVVEDGEIGAATLQVVDFAAAHRRADRRVLQGEQAAESAALFGARQFEDLGVLHRGEEFARLLVNAELAQKVAAGVVGQLAGEASAAVGDAEPVDEVLGKLVGQLAQVGGAAAVQRVFEQDRIAVLDHSNTAAAGSDDGVDVSLVDERPEHVEEMPGHLACVWSMSGVERRLSATGLALG